MKACRRKYIEWGAAGIGALALFLFFFRILPYHLFHREQTQLFLLATEPLAGYLRHPAALARLSGDFLTQFFYYEGGGPAIMAVVLLLWGVVVFRLLVPYMGRWAWIPTVLAVAWEAGRQCGLSYPLSGTIALTGIGGVLLLCRSCMRRSWKSGLAVSILAVLSGYWLFGCGDWSSRWYNMPDLGREYLLALDSEMYFGRSEKVRKLLAEGEYRSPFTAYYYNLLNAQQDRLPDRLMDGYQPASQGLFLPVAPHSTYLTIYAANEVWFALGDMTMAEHAAILGMIFSPHHTGARAVKRLAEINLVNGDEAAAMKYLRLLQKTMCYRDWAERRIPGKQTAEVCQWLERKRLLLPATDTLRSSADPIWHRETELQLMDLQTGAIDSLPMVNSSRSDTYHSWSSGSRWFAFASKRGDGQYGRVYFAYLDAEGKAHKPFVLPQSDPEKDDLTLKSYNIPDLSATPVPFDASSIKRINRQLKAEEFK